MPKFDDERPTEPDLSRLPCPACHGEGEVLQTVDLPDGRHFSKRVKCFTCNGQKTLTREKFALWRIRSR